MNGSVAVCLFLFLFGPPVSLSFAGNKVMVEQSVEELKEVNQDALSQIPDKPSEGTISLKGDVFQSGSERRVEVKEYSIERVKGGASGEEESRGSNGELVNPIEEGRVNVPVR
jgi:hypothetical protein